MADDAELMEASLEAAAGLEFWPALFERFFAVYPHRRASFLNLPASGPRMADETLAMMLGLAKGERWVEPLVAELSFTHRNYGALPDKEYDAFIDLAVGALSTAAGRVWTSAHADAWQRNASLLKTLVARMRRDWTRVMPGAVSA